MDMEKNMGGSQFQIKQLGQKEQNYIAEIKTLERHIDHLTHQLELAHKAMREIQEDRDKLEIEIENKKSFSIHCFIYLQSITKYVIFQKIVKGPQQRQTYKWKQLLFVFHP